jgi:phosphotransferase system  glucose/maltose/N-acetylglucosamine-specific IIC component
MIVAQIGVVNWLFLSLIDFISSKNKWWMRAILWALVIIFLIVISKADKILSKFIKAKEIKEKEGEKEQKLKEATRFIEGVKEGQKLSGELEKKFPKSGGWEQAGARRFKKTY